MLIWSDLDLMTLQAAVLYQYDAAGRITGTNEHDPDSGPRLFLGRTREGNIWHFGEDVPEQLAAELDDVLRTEPAAVDLEAPPSCVDTLVGLLEGHAPVQSVWSGPAWYVPASVSPPPGIDVRPVTDPEIAREEFPYLASELPHLEPCVAVFEAGRVASVCSCSRRLDDAAEAGLHTVEAYRGKGYAVAATAAWAAAVRASGRLPLYSTSWDNHASRRVAAKLGLVLYGADLSID